MRLALAATVVLMLLGFAATASASPPAGQAQTHTDPLCLLLPGLPWCDDDDDDDCEEHHGHGGGHNSGHGGHGGHDDDCDDDDGGGGSGGGGSGGGGSGGGGSGGGGSGGGGSGGGGSGGGGSGGGGSGGGGSGVGGTGGAGGSSIGPGGPGATGGTGTTDASGTLGATAADRAAPAFLAIPRLRPTRFRAARRGGSIAVRTGTTITYRLNEPARVTFTVQKFRHLSRVCRRKARSSRHRTGTRCRRWVSLKGRFAKASVAGPSSVRFTGRLRRRALRPGSYRLVIRARDQAGNVSRPRRPAFRIVR